MGFSLPGMGVPPAPQRPIPEFIACAACGSRDKHPAAMFCKRCLDEYRRLKGDK